MLATSCFLPSYTRRTTDQHPWRLLRLGSGAFGRFGRGIVVTPGDRDKVGGRDYARVHSHQDLARLYGF
jgi:hypothetical protein